MEAKLAITVVVDVLLDSKETLLALWEAEEVAQQVIKEGGKVQLKREGHADSFEGYITDARVLQKSLRE